MKLCINGEERNIENAGNLQELLQQLEVNPGTVIVEHNQQVVARHDFVSQRLESGDVVEIVHFVGGGSPEPGESGAVEGVTPSAETPAANRTHVSPKKPKRSKKTSGVQASCSLVVVESPAKAKTINKFLGKDYQVEASMGHVRDLPKSKMGIDLAQDFTPQYLVMAKAKKTVNYLKKQAKGKKGIYLAPDPDREGEAISWHLAHIFRENDEKMPIHRVFFNEITKEAVLNAFKSPREISMNLVNAQQARRILDRIVGYELSPLLWRKVSRGLSAGRVQSVALRMIVDREREIKSFQPQEYWSLEAKLSSRKEENAGKIFLAKLDKIGAEKAELKNGDETEAVRQAVLKEVFKVAKVDKSERQRRPQAPYTTSKLQQEAYNRLGFPAAKTMSIAQKLYEGIDLGKEESVGLITYMRTDSVNVAVSAVEEVVQYIRTRFGSDYLPDKPPVYKSKKGAQEAHEAIRPTSVKRDPETLKSFLNDDELRLYQLIWQKFVASQMAPAVDALVSISIVAGDKYFFKTTGRRNIFPGFSAVFVDLRSAKNKKEDAEDEEENGVAEDLPELDEGETLQLHELAGNQHFTKPPARFNDASMVKILEEKGIGRPSTYAPTIYTLLSRDYAHRAGGALVPTELGETVVDLLVQHFPKIMDYQFTAGMEEELDKVEEGEMDWVSVVRDFYGPFQQYLEVARNEMKNVRRELTPTEYVCDICGKHLVIRWGRFGKFLACSGFPECKYTRSIPTGFRCPSPDCGGELVRRKSKNKRFFYGCSNFPKCNYITNKLPKSPEEAENGEEAPKSDPEVPAS